MTAITLVLYVLISVGLGAIFLTALVVLVVPTALCLGSVHYMATEMVPLLWRHR